MMTDRKTEVVTVAAVGQDSGRGLRYCFNESPRVFTLSDELVGDGAARRLLALALESHTAVKVTLDLGLPLIHEVALPTSQEVEAIKRARPPLPPERTAARVPIDVPKIDPARFNLVGPYLEWPSFRWCERIVPNEGVAREIFDFCARLACHRAEPPAIAPCIPFQFVKDGCAARAHQMHRIITARFGFCCDKAFAYGLPDEMLTVRASRWGGCCVPWWYHVAPLVRVQTPLGQVAMVFDPSMFDAPVALSDWLAAQEDRICNPAARVNAYAIQDGWAYLPGWNLPYLTDPNYEDTEKTLLLFAALTTC